MKKLMKMLAKILAVLILIVIVAGGVFVATFDANRYKGQIEAQVEKATGHKMTLGSIDLRFFPTLGLTLNQATLSNTKGFGQKPLAVIEKANVGVQLMPLLLDRKLEVKKVGLSGLRLNLVRNKQGVGNWEDLIKAPESSSDALPAGTGGSDTGNKDKPGHVAFKVAHIGGVSIDNSAVHFTDQVTGQQFQLNRFNLDMGALRSDQPAAFQMAFQVALNQPAVKTTVNLDGKLNLDISGQHYGVDPFALKMTAQGATIPHGDQTVALSGHLDYQGQTGRLTLTDARLKAATMVVHTDLDVAGLTQGAKALTWHGPIRIDAFNPRKVMAALGVDDYHPQDKNVMKKASLSGQLKGTDHSASLSDALLKWDATTLRGTLGVTSFSTPSLAFDLDADTLDLDAYMPKTQNQSTSSSTSESSAASQEGTSVPIPVDALDAVGIKGTLQVGHLVVNNMPLSQAKVHVEAPKGSQKAIALAANLYRGGLASTIHITPGKQPVYKMQSKLTGIEIGPLLKDVTGDDFLSGKGNVQVQVHSRGSDVASATKHLDGNVAFSLANGAIKGFNLGRLVRQVGTLVKTGGNIAAAKATPEAKTDFTALRASGTINNGVLTSRDLSGKSPLFRLAGDGTVDLVKQTIDYTVRPTLVDTAVGQGGKELSELKGVTIPVHLTGPLTNIQYKPDIGAVLKDKAKQKVNKELVPEKKKMKKKKHQLENKLKDKLKNKLFG